MSRARAIIGVFGSGSGLELAEEIGSEIAKRHAITLTGGNGNGGDDVKERAIVGAGSNPWIGVERNPPQRKASPLRSGIVIYTDVGHRRNYLEARLCDAAIGIEGGPGTTSEVLFALSLRRPVALVGKWGDPQKPDVLEQMIAKAFERVGKPPSGRPDLDELLSEDAVRRGLNTFPAVKRFDLSDSAKNIVDWILKKVSSGPLLGDFPGLNDYETVAKDYLNWLDTTG